MPRGDHPNSKANLTGRGSFATQEGLASRAGKASGIARRRSSDMRQAAKMALSLVPMLSKSNIEALKKIGFDASTMPSVREVAMLMLANKAMKGDTKAIELLSALSGEDRVDVGENEALAAIQKLIEGIDRDAAK